MRTTITALFAAAALVAGCGDDDNAGGDEGNRSGGRAPAPQTTQTEPEATTPDRAAAVRECIERGRSISDPELRRTVEEACRAAQTGDPSEALDAAREQCLEAAASLPAGDVRNRARDACKEIDG